MIHEIDERLFPGFSHFKKIGEGAFGKVFTALNSKTNIQVAIKCVDKINLMTEANRTVFQSELAIYNKIEHPFLTQFYATTEDNAGVYIALEFGEKGTLLDRVVSQRKLKEQQACKIFCEIISALNYLHNTAKIIHRDIKAENIIVDNNDDIRLIDFGLSSFMNTKEEMNERCGTFVYSSPEMLRGIPYTQSIDIWSCGILLYLMVTGTFPFASEDQRELKQDICFKDPQIPTSISKDCRDLLLKLLTKEPSERITIEEIAVHPWILANRASYYPTTQFNENLKYVITPHDKSDINSLVVNSLSKNGCNISTLESDLLDGRLTESTILYKYFLKRQFLMKLHSPEEIRAGKNQIHNLKKLISCQPEHSAIKHPSSQISPMKKMPQKTTKPRSHSVSLKIFIPQNTSQQSALPALTPSPNQRKMIFL